MGVIVHDPVMTKFGMELKDLYASFRFYPVATDVGESGMGQKSYSVRTRYGLWKDAATCMGGGQPLDVRRIVVVLNAQQLPDMYAELYAGLKKEFKSVSDA